MGKKSRDKGKRFERLARDWFKQRGFDARRGQQHCGSPDSPDILVDGLEFLHLEIKSGKTTPNVYAAISQVQGDCPDGALPVVMLKRDREEWLFVVSADDLSTWSEGRGIILR